LSSSGEVVEGYVAAKVYEEMAEVGPLICQASQPDMAETLLKTVLSQLHGLYVSMCLPKKETSLTEMLKQFGFKEEFTVSRMFLGSNSARDCMYIVESLERG
jgi:hypothetical protein